MNIAPTVRTASRDGATVTLDLPEFPYSPSILPGVAQAVDATALVLAGAAATLAAGSDGTSDRATTCVVFVIFVHLMLGGWAQLFSIPAIMRPIRRADDVLLSIVTAFLLLMSVLFAFEAAEGLSLSWLALLFVLSVCLTIGGRLALFHVLRGLARRNLIGSSMVVLGAGEQSRRFLRRYGRSGSYFTRIVGVFTGEDAPTDGTFEGQPVLGGMEALLAAAREHKIDDVVIAMPWNADRHVAETVERLKELPINVYLSADLVGFELAFRPATGDVGDLPLFEVVQRPISGWASALKTAEDYLIAVTLLIVTAPLLMAIATAIKIESPGPVLFRQARLGFNNKTFHIYKFRSMRHAPEAEVEVRQATRGDPRVTRVGRFIRATSLDELPQLLNVLNGTMSLVGPRPHAVSHNEEYGRQIRGYFARHKVRPGITGWAQVNGLRGETETIDKMEARIRHDIYYAENWSLLFDLRILVLTALLVLFQKTAY